MTLHLMHPVTAMPERSLPPGAQMDKVRASPETEEEPESEEEESSSSSDDEAEGEGEGEGEDGFEKIKSAKEKKKVGAPALDPKPYSARRVFGFEKIRYARERRRRRGLTLNPRPCTWGWRLQEAV